MAVVSFLPCCSPPEMRPFTTSRALARPPNGTFLGRPAADCSGPEGLSSATTGLSETRPGSPHFSPAPCGSPDQVGCHAKPLRFAQESTEAARQVVFRELRRQVTLLRPMSLPVIPRPSSAARCDQPISR